MTAPEILRIAVTVGVIQLLCDVIARWRIFSKEPYHRALGALSRSKFKLDKEKAAAAAAQTTTVVVKESGGKKASKAEKSAKKLQRAEDDHKEALAAVAQRHTVPNMATSILFVIVLRVMGLELKGKIIALLPFAPFAIVQRVTGRSLEFADIEFEGTDKVSSVSQAAAFLFVYGLVTMSVKYYLNRLFGTQPPPGAESLLSVMDSPTGKKLLGAAGINPDDLKME